MRTILFKLIKVWLKFRGLDWFSLRAGDVPSRLAQDKPLYWLNPTDQRSYNYGWFTLTELALWGLSRGPIPKANREAICYGVANSPNYKKYLEETKS